MMLNTECSVYEICYVRNFQCTRRLVYDNITYEALNVQKVLERNIQCMKNPVYETVNVRKVLCAKHSVYNTFYVRNIQCIKNALYKTFNVQKILCTKRSMYKKSEIRNVWCFLWSMSADTKQTSLSGLAKTDVVTSWYFLHLDNPSLNPAKTHFSQA